MKIIEKGYSYDLENHDNGMSQRLNFIKKAPTDDDPEALETVTDGTTNEEVLAVLIDRLTFQNGNLPDRFSTEGIRCLQAAARHLEERKSQRQLRGVEGMMKA